MKKVAVVGAGTMGNGISQVAAEAGFEVLLYDKNPNGLEQGLKRIEKTLKRNVEKGKNEKALADQIRERIKPTS